jgi:regulator of protease activity HflC (stomatin/prohibitin superfamily)
VDGVLSLKVLDSYKACYGVEDYRFAVAQLAQTAMRSEIGKIELDKTFEEREALNAAIVSAINEAAAPWGIQVCATRSRISTRPAACWRPWSAR